jgi:hypothetical protein
MILDESVHGMRLHVMERAQVLGNVSAVCTEHTRRRLWRARHGRTRHVEATEPGQLVCLDTFYIGQLKGVGKVWQITACDAATSDGRAGRHVPARGGRAALPAGRLAGAPCADRWRPRVQGRV